MDSNDYKYFSTLVKELNISRAAEKLYITPQALSKRIIRLEEYYKVKLFERKPSLQLTYAGQRLLDYYKELDALEEHARMEMDDISNGFSGILKISISSIRATQIIPVVFPEYHRKYPHISIEVHDAHTKQLLQNLTDGSADVTIATSTISSPEITSISLSEEAIFFYISDSILHEKFEEEYEDMLWKEKTNTPVSIQEFFSCPFIISLPGNRIYEKISTIFSGYNFVPNIILTASNKDLRLRLASDGFGVTAVADSVSIPPDQEELDRMNLHRFSVNELRLSDSIKLSYLTNRYLPKYIKDFIELVKNYFEDETNE